MDFLATHNRLKDDFEVQLKKVFNGIDAPKKIIEAMEYSLFLDGKRLRPVIMLYMARQLGIADNVILPLCNALEMIHTYSLIHDDLPAMDNDDFRRGKPSNHKIFGVDMAILAGDGLLNSAFDSMLQNCPEENVYNYVKAVSYMAKSAGVQGMIGGQVIDISNQANDIVMLRKLHSLKTGKLFNAAIMPVVYLAELSVDEVECYQTFCDNFGLLFQITDDILDVTGEEEKVGKTLGKDTKDGKVTYVSLYGLEVANKHADKAEKACLEQLEKLSEDGYLSALVRYIRRREK